MYCFVCRMETISLDVLQSVDTISPFSKKTLRAIIEHLAKTNSYQIDLKWPKISSKSFVCTTCLNDLMHYDECMMKVLRVQKRITSIMQSAYNCSLLNTTKYDCEEDIRLKEIVDLNSLHEDEFFDENENNSAIHADDALSEVEDAERTKFSKKTRKYNVPIACELCKKVFKNKSRLAEHTKKEHKSLKDVYKCEECGVTVRDEEYLELHMNLHEGKSEIECRYCSKRFARRVNVIRHMQKHWDKKKFQCEKCGVRFSEKHLLYNHRLQHDAEEKPLVCNICEQSFKTRRTFKNHIWTHREDRPRFSCQFCGKTFVEKYTLKVHLRTHTRNEPVESSWRRKMSVTSIPDDERVFECVICGNSFPNIDKFNLHMEGVHDVIIKSNS